MCNVYAMYMQCFLFLKVDIRMLPLNTAMLSIVHKILPPDLLL